MKRFHPAVVASICSLAIFSGAGFAQSVGAPPVFADYLQPNKPVRGQQVIVMPPKEISAFIKKVEEAAFADPDWFREYSKNAKPGVPLPFHEKLGLTKDEYAEYIELWDARKMTPVPEGNVVVELQDSDSGEWVIRVLGKKPSRISLLKYNPKDDTFRSPNGQMTRLADIDADERSILGKWTGKEWKFEEEDSLGKLKENFAIGKLDGTKYGLLVYRVQSTTSSGRPTGDSSVVIRFLMAEE